MSSELTISEDQSGFTTHQAAALSQLGVQDASPADLAVFFHQVQRTGLDPFARQIYMISRRQKDYSGNWVTKQTIQTGIDGFRLIARRSCDKTGDVLSISQPYYATADGHWLDFWPYDYPPVAAKVMVKRGGGEFPAVAMFKEYAGTTKGGQLTRMWAEKPAVMIGKCAEALALRKAFPLDLSGLYTAEEMAQADTVDSVPAVAPSAPSPAPVEENHTVTLITQEQAIELDGLIGQLGHSPEKVKALVSWASHGRTYDPTTLTDAEAAKLLNAYRSELDKMMTQPQIDIPDVAEDPYGGDPQ